VGHFHRAFLHAVHHAKGRHQLATGMDGNLKLAARHLGDLLGEHLGGTEDGVQGLGKAGSQTPAQLRLSVHDGGGATGGQNASQAGMMDE